LCCIESVPGTRRYIVDKTVGEAATNIEWGEIFSVIQAIVLQENIIVQEQQLGLSNGRTTPSESGNESWALKLTHF
jgi:hypothetical protein